MNHKDKNYTVPQNYVVNLETGSGGNVPKEVSLKFPSNYSDKTEKAAGISCLCCCDIP